MTEPAWFRVSHACLVCGDNIRFRAGYRCVTCTHQQNEQNGIRLTLEIAEAQRKEEPK